MIKRPLGKTGIEVSEIAFGGVEIGMPYGIGVRSETDMLRQDEAVNLLHRALDRGINFFDTARMYGNSEVLMGQAFRGRRSQVVLGTKCRHFRDQNGLLPVDKELPGIIFRSVQESLDALRTDYLDLLMIHQADREIIDNEAIADAFLTLKNDGKIRAMGVSTYSVAETRLVLEKNIWDVIQLPFNLMDQRQESCFEEASNKGVGLVVRSVLLKGLLSDRGQNLPKPLEKVEQHIRQFDRLRESFGWNLPTLATKFALSFKQVSSVLVGIDREQYLDDALHAGDGSYLDKQGLAMAKALEFSDPGFINLHHWTKMGWLT
ncbi:MAG TPA: aldo/keto reductase [Cyclobacteriaceae bacterium]|nr:aldo/keto reductase [Cyclobacteriaceae bacterium]